VARIRGHDTWGYVVDLTLARLEAGVLLVDDIGPAAAPDDAAVLVALLERTERIADFHGTPFDTGKFGLTPPKRREASRRGFVCQQRENVGFSPQFRGERMLESARKLDRRHNQVRRIAATILSIILAAHARPLKVVARRGSGFRPFRDRIPRHRLGRWHQGRNLQRGDGKISRNQRVADLNLNQPEFASPVWTYLDTAVSTQRIADGRASWRATPPSSRRLPRNTGTDGNPGSIWGNESDYAARWATSTCSSAGDAGL